MPPSLRFLDCCAAWDEIGAVGGVAALRRGGGSEAKAKGAGGRWGVASPEEIGRRSGEDEERGSVAASLLAWAMAGFMVCAIK